MKSNFLRAALALAVALGLASCGGKASFEIKGSITGLVYPGLVLWTNGMDLSVAPGATTFVFPNTISYGDVFNLAVDNVGSPKTQPQHQHCVIVNPSDTAGRTAVINVQITCALNTFSIGGPITGLTSDGLVLTNGTLGGTVAPANGAASFVFANKVPYAASYGVTVLTQPASNTCAVTQNGTGVMGDADVNNITVVCVPK